MKRNVEFENLWAEAVAAGEAAAEAAKPPVMVVERHVNMADDNSPVEKRWIVPDGPCGFAWIEVQPGNSSFANWLKRNGLGRKGWPSGVHVWVSKFRQSMVRKEAFARAAAKVLRDAGIKAYAGSRMD